MIDATVTAPVLTPDDEAARRRFSTANVLRIAAAMPGTTNPLDPRTVRVMTAFAKVARDHEAALTALARL